MWMGCINKNMKHLSETHQLCCGFIWVLTTWSSLSTAIIKRRRSQEKRQQAGRKAEGETEREMETPDVPRVVRAESASVFLFDGATSTAAAKETPEEIAARDAERLRNQKL